MSAGRLNSRKWIAGGMALFLLSLSLLAGCAHNPPSLYGGPGTAPSPGAPWTAPARVTGRAVPTPPTPAIPAELEASRGAWSLAQTVNIALRCSPETRATWASARAAAAAYGSRRGDWLPGVDLNAYLNRYRGASTGGGEGGDQRTYGGSADLTWLLFNFGGRRAGVDEMRQALVAANWTHNAVIQSVLLRVEQAYYEHVTARALLAAEEATLKEAQTNLNSAEERRKAGLATIADVLQARTALSQVQLAVESLRGQVATTRGALATAMGLPVNTPFEVEMLPEEVPAQQTSESVERYLEQARANRPDLAAARALALKADATVRRVRAEGYPSLWAVGSVGRVYWDNPDDLSRTFSAALQLRLPLFTGFSHQYDVLESRADAERARAELQSLEQAVMLQVWTSYYDFKTAEQRLKTTDDLMRSASESHDVALGRYQAGVGTILDLMATQAALEGARAQQVQARADWYISLAQLAHDTGTLGPSGAPGGGGDPR